VNKLVSQIASKLNKPAAFAEIPPGQEISFLHPLQNKWLPGIGPKTAIRLNAAGLAYIGQIAATPLDCFTSSWATPPGRSASMPMALTAVPSFQPANRRNHLASRKPLGAI